MKKESIQIQFVRDFQSSFRTLPRFFSRAQELRTNFEERFHDPYRASPGRFCWDFWSVPGQYRLLRTPAESFFPTSLFHAFLTQLLSWGRMNLGCQMVSHPWLSAYIDGCYQNLHSDVPHGPFSFVYSLTPWNTRKFTGGETLLAKPNLLRYFQGFDPETSHEERDFLHALPQPFGQLTIFDPRFPHGVRPVQGVEAIQDSRLVIHGWFTEPRPSLSGTLSFKKILSPMDRVVDHLIQTIDPDARHSGLLSLRLDLASSGAISKVSVLSANLLDESGSPIARSLLSSAIGSLDLRFPRSRGKSHITIPIQFSRRGS